MSYLTFDQYIDLGGGSCTEDAFDAAEVRAELILDEITLGRLHEVDWTGWEARVQRAMLIIIETLPALDESFRASVEGTRLTSFNNGVDSLGFQSGEADEDAALMALVREVQALLPVELSSRCVGWNHAG